MEEVKKEETVKPDVTTGIMDEAKAIAERLEKANAERKALLDREEQLEARKILSGRAEAGTTPIPPKVLTPQEYAKKVLNGEINPLKDA